MANIDVYFKYDGTNLLFSNEEAGTYTQVNPDTVTCEPNPGDTLTFHGLDGIAKLNKIVDGCQGSKKVLKRIKTIIVCEVDDDCQPGDLDKYDVTFKATKKQGGKKHTVDPMVKVKTT